MNIAAVIQSLLFEAEEKTFCLLISCKFYLLLSLLLRQEKKYFVY